MNSAPDLLERPEGECDFDDDTCRLEPIENPFAAKLFPIAPE
jgi:hypothetical protein